MNDADLERVRAEAIEETFTTVRYLLMKAAAGHEELARRYPNGLDRVKAETLRRFAENFLP